MGEKSHYVMYRVGCDFMAANVLPILKCNIFKESFGGIEIRRDKKKKYLGIALDGQSSYLFKYECSGARVYSCPVIYTWCPRK